MKKYSKYKYLKVFKIQIVLKKYLKYNIQNTIISKLAT